MRRLFPIALALLAAGAPAFAWGGKGHRIIGELAAKNFPAEIPAFLKTPTAVTQIGLMAQEPDISRNGGVPHDFDLDPGHFLDASDDGTVLEGPKLSALPASRRDFDTALRAVNSNEYASGYLPYNLMDGYEQLVKDFALLRMDMAAQKNAAKFNMTASERKAFADAQAVRQILTLRDLGYWAHFVGDASQPLHVTVHFNGWGDGPNPGGFVTTPGLHSKFESAFVDAHVGDADVAAKLRAPRACAVPIQACVQDYLIATQQGVNTVYQFEKDGAFDAATPAAKDFTAARIADGAAMLRDLVTGAWAAAGNATLGYHIKQVVTDIEAGKADPRQLD
jgi:hypothetical protein